MAAADRLLLGISQQRVFRPQSLQVWQARMHERVAAAVQAGAELLVFPEYGALELTALQPDAVRADLAASLAALQEWRAVFLHTFQALAGEHAVAILAPSFPWQIEVATGMHYVNRAWWCTPDHTAYQDKLSMTRFEAEHWGIRAADPLQLLHWRGVRIGVQICYDSEFPLASRRLYEAGVELLLVPSCTDGWAGYHRVRTGCKARALEGQMLVAQAPLTGDAPWSPAIDENRGRAALYAPSDRGFPANGVVARAWSSRSEWLLATADFTALRALRADPQVWNPRDWALQQRPGFAALQSELR